MDKIKEWIIEQLETATPRGGNEIDGTHVLHADLVEGDVLVELEDGRTFAVTVGEV